jgi:hypothetical protein
MAEEFLPNPEAGAPPPAAPPPSTEPAEDAAAEEGSDIAADTEFRPCAFCGTSIHSKSHRCPDCGGHVGVAWGTVALAIFGMFRAVISLFNRSMIVWPFFVNAMLALWVGISGISASTKSALWKQYSEMEHTTMAGKFEDPLRAIPPGFWLLTIAGALVVLVVLKGVVAGFASGGGAKAAAKKDAGRRRR